MLPKYDAAELYITAQSGPAINLEQKGKVARAWIKALVCPAWLMKPSIKYQVSTHLSYST